MFTCLFLPETRVYRLRLQTATVKIKHKKKGLGMESLRVLCAELIFLSIFREDNRESANRALITVL